MPDEDNNPPMDDDRPSSGAGDAENPPMDDDMAGSDPTGLSASPRTVDDSDAGIDVEANPLLEDDSPSMAVDHEGNPPMDDIGSAAELVVEDSENPPMSPAE